MGGERPPVAVLGAGSWGTALAIHLARTTARVRLWARDSIRAETIGKERCNRDYLPGHTLPPSIEVTDSLEAALRNGALVLVAVPSDGFEDLMARLGALAAPLGPLLCATKGLEPASGRFLFEVAKDSLPRASIGLLSGPTFAAEVAAGLPAAITVAASDAELARGLAARLHSPRFRVYPSTDMVGVAIGGAVKNVLAIAAGIADGLEFGNNARAALITRGLAELSRLGRALGGRPETLMGLSGLGDLVLTCTGEQSRNRRFGLLIAAGHGRSEARRLVGQAVEGMRTASQAQRLASSLDVEMPIVEAVARVLAGELRPAAAVEALLAREPRFEE